MRFDPLEEEFDDEEADEEYGDETPRTPRTQVAAMPVGRAKGQHAASRKTEHAARKARQIGEQRGSIRNRRRRKIQW